MAKISVIKPDMIQGMSNDDLFVKLVVDGELDKKAQLIVPPTHRAILVKDGQMLQTLESGKYDIYDKKSDLSGFFFKRFETDSVEIIYMSKTARLRMPWGTPRQLELRDPLTDIPLKIGANGEFEIRIGEPRKFFLEVVGMAGSYDLDKLQERVLAKLMSEFQPALIKTMREKRLTYCMADEYTKEIAEGVAPILGGILSDNYGITMCDFFIGRILIPEACKAEIEAVLKSGKEETERREREEKEEKKRIERRDEEKRELKEYLADLERLTDKEWEKEKYMRELEARDYERYLEVCRAVGWKRDAKGGDAKADGGKDGSERRFCTKCGAAAAPDDVFCSKCGKRI
ncbi:hypothetical protein FACS1894211_11860 [Clostridia bacterium]|nr:hypothetical protein FACS1894211_11860 [Clostridia bacterium]